MVCPVCHGETQVSNSRVRGGGFAVWRRRRCRSCLDSFTTLEQILTESAVAFKAADGSLKPLDRQSIYLNVLNALNDAKTPLKAAEYLTATCIEKILSEKTATLEQKTIEKRIFETLNAFDPLASQRYLLNELKRTEI